ncbi:MAG: hypothetical protein ACP5E9_10115 [Candidatus Methanospirareceae archaeon]
MLLVIILHLATSCFAAAANSHPRVKNRSSGQLQRRVKIILAALIREERVGLYLGSAKDLGILDAVLEETGIETKAREAVQSGRRL